MFPADGAQFSSFLTAFLLGIGLGVLYEAFRVPRLLFRISPVLVFVADTLYFFLCSVILFLFVFFTNDGQLRLFLLLSTVVGCLFYALTAGRAVRYLAAKLRLRLDVVRKKKKKE